MEALRIIKCGFPIRCSYERIYEMFGGILQGYATPVSLPAVLFLFSFLTWCDRVVPGQQAGLCRGHDVLVRR